MVIIFPTWSRIEAANKLKEDIESGAVSTTDVEVMKLFRRLVAASMLFFVILLSYIVYVAYLMFNPKTIMFGIAILITEITCAGVMYKYKQHKKIIYFINAFSSWSILMAIFILVR